MWLSDGVGKLGRMGGISSAAMITRGGKTFEKDQSIPGTARGVKAACVGSDG